MLVVIPRTSRKTRTGRLCRDTFVCVLIESAKSVYLVVPNVRNRGVHKAGGLGTDCRDHFRFVAFGG